MCYYNVVKCVRCRRVHPQEYILCENLEHGAICIDQENLIKNSVNLRTSNDNTKSTLPSSRSNIKVSSVDLFYILRHMYQYTDGCLSCGG